MYSHDLREKVLEFVSKGKRIPQVAEEFGISQSSIYLWLKREGEGILAPSKWKPKEIKLHSQAVLEYIKANPDRTLKEMAPVFNVHYSTLSYFFKRMKIKRKKKQLLMQKGNEREAFKQYIISVRDKPIIFLDESGIDNKLQRDYARVPRGVKIYKEVPGKKRKRISVIAGLLGKKVIAPMVFQGSCNNLVFNSYLEQCLLTKLPPEAIIIMDNASFHKCSLTKELIEKAGCILKYLPSYSPDLNPIEHKWHELKSLIRKLHPFTNLLDTVYQAVTELS